MEIIEKEKIVERPEGYDNYGPTRRDINGNSRREGAIIKSIEDSKEA